MLRNKLLPNGLKDLSAKATSYLEDYPSKWLDIPATIGNLLLRAVASCFSLPDKSKGGTIQEYPPGN